MSLLFLFSHLLSPSIYMYSSSKNKLLTIPTHSLSPSIPPSLHPSIPPFPFLPPSLPLALPPLQNADLQVKLDQATSKQQKEKEEWAMRQRALQDQLSDIQEECRLAMRTGETQRPDHVALYYNDRKVGVSLASFPGPSPQGGLGTRLGMA